RVTDKRKVRHDHADIFCTLAEGVRGQRAKEWRLVDDVVKPAKFQDTINARALELAGQDNETPDIKGIALTPLEKHESANGLDYKHVSVEIDRKGKFATFTIRGP